MGPTTPKAPRKKYTPASTNSKPTMPAALPRHRAGRVRARGLTHPHLKRATPKNSLPRNWLPASLESWRFPATTMSTLSGSGSGCA
jgi:hypothetical protein